MKRRSQTRDRGRWHFVLAAVAVYVLAATTTYRFRHPAMTETQLAAHFLDAVTWSCSCDACRALEQAP